MGPGSVFLLLADELVQVAALQGYLLRNKTRPKEAVNEVAEWRVLKFILPRSRGRYLPELLSLMQGHQRTGDAGEAQKGEGRGLWLTHDRW